MRSLSITCYNNCFKLYNCLQFVLLNLCNLWFQKYLKSSNKNLHFFKFNLVSFLECYLYINHPFIFFMGLIDQFFQIAWSAKSIHDVMDEKVRLFAVFIYLAQRWRGGSHTNGHAILIGWLQSCDVFVLLYRACGQWCLIAHFATTPLDFINHTVHHMDIC